MKELIAAVAAEKGLTKVDVQAVLDAVLEGIIKRLRSDGKVRLGDFGTFEVTKRKARTGRNPRTGEKLEIPASILPKFKPGRHLKDQIATLSEVPGK